MVDRSRVSNFCLGKRCATGRRRRWWNYCRRICLTAPDEMLMPIEGSFCSESNRYPKCISVFATNRRGFRQVPLASDGSHTLKLIVLAGATIGSASIDHDFELLVRARLEQVDRTARLIMSPQETAWEMMKSKDFQNTKCEHGGPDECPIFSVHVPKLNTAYSNPALRIQNGEMSFTRSVLSCTILSDHMD